MQRGVNGVDTSIRQVHARLIATTQGIAAQHKWKHLAQTILTDDHEARLCQLFSNLQLDLPFCITHSSHRALEAVVREPLGLLKLPHPFDQPPCSATTQPLLTASRQTLPAASSILLFTQDFSLGKISRRIDPQAPSKTPSPVSERIIQSRAKDSYCVRHFSMPCPLFHRRRRLRVPLGRPTCPHTRNAPAFRR